MGCGSLASEDNDKDCCGSLAPVPDLLQKSEFIAGASCIASKFCSEAAALCEDGDPVCFIEDAGIALGVADELQLLHPAVPPTAEEPVSLAGTVVGKWMAARDVTRMALLAIDTANQSPVGNAGSMSFVLKPMLDEEDRAPPLV